MFAPSTRPSLLNRLRDRDDYEAWYRFDASYGPVILRYCLRRGLQMEDAEDVRQVVLINLARRLGSFRYMPERGRFRDYLGRVVQNTIIRELSRRSKQPELRSELVLADATTTDRADSEWHEEWMLQHYRRAMRSLERSFRRRNLDVFRRLMSGESLQGVAAAMELSNAAVAKVKQRVRRRLEELVAQQIEDEEREVG